jgi:polyhydroxyalkanoate synthase
MWRTSETVARTLGFMPMEILQAAFWQIDPDRLVAKFARFAAAEDGSPEAERFMILEDWANGGEPLPLPAARQLIEGWFEGGENLAPLPSCPMLHVTASSDRIVPAETAAPGDQLSSPSGHVGMIVGGNSTGNLHVPLLSWLEGVARDR